MSPNKFGIDFVDSISLHGLTPSHTKGLKIASHIKGLKLLQIVSDAKGLKMASYQIHAALKLGINYSKIKRRY